MPRGLLGLLSKTQDEVRDFFENLGWETYEFEQANQFSGYPTSDEYAFYANPSPPDHFLNSSTHIVLLCCVIIVNVLLMMFLRVLIVLPVQDLKTKLMI